MANLSGGGKMKKFVFAVLPLVAFVFLFAGCSETPAPTAQTTDQTATTTSTTASTVKATSTTVSTAKMPMKTPTK